MALFQAAEHVKSLIAEVVEPFGITGQQYNVLRILRAAGPDGLPTLSVAQRMIERAPGITRMMDRLEAKGLVARERSPEDRRSVECRITTKGLDLLKRLDQPVNEMDQSAFAALDSDELVQLRRLLERLPAG